MSELGRMLREAREAKGISLAEAEEATKIREKYLQALEEANYEVLPPGIYVRGFLRNYASFLGLNPDEAIAAFHNGAQDAQLAEPRIISEPLVPGPRVSSELIAGIVMLVVVGVLLVFVYRRYIAPLAAEPASPTPTVAQALGLAPMSIPTVVGANDPIATSADVATPPPPSPTPVPPTPAATPTSQPSATETPMPAIVEELVLGLAATEACWVRVVLDGETDFEGILESGDQRIWTAKREIFVRIGNAGGIIASLNGKQLEPLGESGQVLNLAWSLSDTGEVIESPPQ